MADGKKYYLKKYNFNKYKFFLGILSSDKV